MEDDGVKMPPPEYNPKAAKDREAYPNAGMLVDMSPDRFRTIMENARGAANSGDESVLPLANGLMELSVEVGSQQHRFNLMLLRESKPALQPEPVQSSPSSEPAPVVQNIVPISRPVLFEAAAEALTHCELTDSCSVAEFMAHTGKVVDRILELLEVG